MIYSIYQHDRWGQRSLSNHTYILLCMNRAFQQKKPAVLTNALVSECESCKQHRWYIVTCCIHIGQYVYTGWQHQISVGNLATS